jgi:hypothetical protein
VTALAAAVFAVAAALAVAFQLALAAGAPWGEYAMGGRYPGRFPGRLRVAALIQGGVIALLALIVATRAGIIATPLDAPWLIWLVVAFSAASLVVNAISRSPGERRLWVPVAIVMLASSLVVALGGS